MATLKNMTRVGADVRQIARLLQAKAPENHMLAYITPEEAQLLRNRGGSGMPDAETGIPSFAPAFDYGSTETPVYDYGPEPTETFSTPVQTSSVAGVDLAPAFNPAQSAASVDYSQFAPAPVPQYADTSFRGPPTPEFLPSVDRAAIFGPAGYGPPPSPAELAPFDTTPSKTIGERYSDLAKSLGIEKSDLSRLGIAGVSALIGERTSRKAAEQGQRGKAEIQALAQPYQTRGAELQRQAQAGELTPVARQQLQAAQAQAAQAASARGGVGAQQTAARVEAIRNQLLQQQNDYGMKLTSIGDQITLGAIRTGLQADQYANQLTSSYFNNIMRTLAGTPTVTQTTQTTTTGG
jgi:hypothetical protein